MPAGHGSNRCPCCSFMGEDEFAVKQRARQIFQQWTEELGGMDHEIIDCAGGE